VRAAIARRLPTGYLADNRRLQATCRRLETERHIAPAGPSVRHVALDEQPREREVLMRPQSLPPDRPDRKPEPPGGALTTAQLDYELPAERIATRPVEPRDAARLMVVHRSSETVDHRHVRDLPELLVPGDTLVLNRTAVAPARLIGRRHDSGGRIEGLFLEEAGHAAWLVMLRSNSRLRDGQRIDLEDQAGRPVSELELLERRAEHWLVAVRGPGDTASILEAVGRTPLPPYIRRARGDDEVDDASDRAWYQTVYADQDRCRSVAAPTAGLHFTPGLLAALEKRGIGRLDVVLHVGPGTFKPITAATPAGHVMHRERYEVPAGTVKALRERAGQVPSRRGRLIAVGTTAVRTLESLDDPLPAADAPISSQTDLLISPPYDFRHVDGLLTNFHLPRSTLLALVAAMVGLPRLLALYRLAVEREYRFYSYGDAMLILP
jgi:S-adenosylmethionine:tRNA ribosyltransferase-isomerase